MKKHIEAEKGELIIVSDEGHRAIIPAKDRKYFLDSLNGCDDCINKYIQQLPMMSNYAEDGSLVPDDGDPIKKETYEQWGDRIRKMAPNLDYTKDGDYNYRGAYEAGLEPVEVDNNGVKEYHLGSRNPKTGEILKYRSHPTFNQAISEDVKMGYVPYEKDGRIYTVDRKSKEYKDLYDSGKLLGYDRVNDLYIAPDLGGATIKATKPQWMKDKEALEKEYSKDWYIDNILPKFSRSMGVSADNMHPNNVKEYDSYINDKVAESILKRNPKVGFSNNERLAWYNSLSEKERDIVNNSYFVDKFSPAVRAYMESQSNEVKKYGILETFRDVNKLAQSVEGTPERFRIFPNAENNYENYVNPLMWIGDMAKGLGNVPKDIKEENYLKAAGSVASTLLGGALGGLGAKTKGQFIKNIFLPLGGLEENIVKGGKNLADDVLVSKLSKADKVIDAAKAIDKISDVSKPTNRLKFDDLKNDNEFFRVIVGDEAFDDIVQTQKIRTKQPSSVKNTPPNTINLDRRGSTAFPSFSKGSPSLEYAKNNPNHYIIKTADESIQPSTSGRHGKGTTMFPTDKSGKHLTELDASKTQVYKHIGNGEYELVDVTEAGSKMLNKTDDVVKTATSSVDDVNKSVKPAWQLEELPGLHLKSTMEGEAISKIVEPKTGLINVEQALGIIGKESGGAEKVKLVREALGDNIPKKMDFNEFRKITQDQLIPLERQFSEQASNYGVGRLGYPSPKRSSYEKAIKHNEEMIAHYKKQIAEGSNNSSLRGDLQNAINNLENSKKELATLPLENQTLILGNKGKFGRGSSAHGNPDETLGHAHFLRDAETPDVLTVTQIQSDAFQGTHRIMPKTQQEALEKVNKLKDEGVEIKSMFGDGKESSNAVLANYEKHLQLDEASAKNFTQKQLLDKNHQERYLQELVDYAGKRGDINKVRVPTPETAAKVQGHNWRASSADDFILSAYKESLSNLKKLNVNPTLQKELQSKITILEKYAEQPKTIKKLFGVEPKVVTDSKGNTWYEFDIPKKFKKGKGEIKAFGLIPPAIGIGTVIQSQNKNKTEQ